MKLPKLPAGLHLTGAFDGGEGYADTRRFPGVVISGSGSRVTVAGHLPVVIGATGPVSACGSAWRA